MATEAFLGSLPEGWEGKWVQFGGDARYAYYRNGVATFEDPRLGLLPPEWSLCNVDLEGEESPDSLQDVMFENSDTGKKQYHDPRLTSALLLKEGKVLIKEIGLV